MAALFSPLSARLHNLGATRCSPTEKRNCFTNVSSFLICMRVLLLFLVFHTACSLGGRTHYVLQHHIYYTFMEHVLHTQVKKTKQTTVVWLLENVKRQCKHIVSNVTNENVVQLFHNGCIFNNKSLCPFCKGNSRNIFKARRMPIAHCSCLRQHCWLLVRDETWTVSTRIACHNLHP